MKINPSTNDNDDHNDFNVCKLLLMIVIISNSYNDNGWDDDVHGNKSVDFRPDIAIMTYSALSYFISTLQRTMIQSLSVSFICLSV